MSKSAFAFEFSKSKKGRGGGRRRREADREAARHCRVLRGGDGLRRARDPRLGSVCVMAFAALAIHA